MQINRLGIKNFKSIKNLELDCKRINIFIGEPNTGKSNLLEAIGLVSHISYGKLNSFVRFETMMDLFYDRNLSDTVEISFDEHTLNIVFKDGNFFGKMRTRETTSQSQVQGVFQYGYEGGTSYRLMHPCQDFKFYRFASISQFTDTKSDFLMPPDGKNLLHVLLTSKELKQVLTGLFKKFGYRIVFKPQEGKIEVQKELEDIIIAIPYALTSETLQRIAFYLAAVYSNKESIISFEEPEAHAFPYYMKFLAERIAMDKNKNQYFIATHNPYFLMAIIEKTPKTEIAAFATYFEDYQTKAKVLSSEEIESALSMGADFFFNIDQFVKKDECVGN